MTNALILPEDYHVPRRPRSYQLTVAMHNRQFLYQMQLLTASELG